MARSSIKVASEGDVTSSAEETLDFDDDNLRAIAEVYKNQGNEEYRKRDFINAIHFYTEGIKVNCKDDELDAKLYCNRAIANFKLGNYQDSLSDAKAATALQPIFLKAIVRGASACVELNQLEEAIAWCDKGLAGEDTTEAAQNNAANESEVTASVDETLDFDDDNLRGGNLQFFGEPVGPGKEEIRKTRSTKFNPNYVLEERIAAGTDAELRKEQAGFREGRSTIKQIFVLRNIVEQAVEWNSSLYLCFVDYEKAFDSIHRSTLWKIMKCYEIPSKIVRMVQVMYTNSTSVVIDGGRTDWFEVQSGVKQGCNMSGFLFLLVIDWVMRRTVVHAGTGIRWKMTTTLEDLDFADDLALI
ncbi:hypothetical protein ACROYT_G010273 [Oculina patagonica]